MDMQSRRERMKSWIAVGVREGLTFKALARRAGVHERTLRAWRKVFLHESASGAGPDREEHTFVELVERSGANSSRIEVVLPGDRRIEIAGAAILEALCRPDDGGRTMFRLPVSIRVFASTKPITGRADVDTLLRLVRDDIGEDPFSGALFCFFNRRHDRVKILVWDRNGFWILSKRLERGYFEPLDTRARRVELAREQLVMLLAGIDTRTSRFRRRFAREVRISSRADDDARSARSAQ